jgi:hypothetical protein
MRQVELEPAVRKVRLACGSPRKLQPRSIASSVRGQQPSQVPVGAHVTGAIDRANEATRHGSLLVAEQGEVVDRRHPVERDLEQPHVRLAGREYRFHLERVPGILACRTVTSTGGHETSPYRGYRWKFRPTRRSLRSCRRWMRRLLSSPLTRLVEERQLVSKKPFEAGWQSVGRHAAATTTDVAHDGSAPPQSTIF